MKTLLLPTFLFILSSTTIAQAPGNVSSNLVLWLKADGNVYNTGTTQATNSQSIDKWDGAGSTTVDANQNTSGVGANKAKPIFRKSPALNINYNPVISFDGTQRFKLSSTTLSAGAANNALFVVKATTSGTIFVQETAGAVVPKFNSDGSMTISKNAGWTIVPGGGDGGGIPTLNSFSKNTSNVVKSYRDGSEFASLTMSANPRSTLTGDNYIGERATCCNAPLVGNIAEIIGYNQTTLSGTSKNQIDSYLAVKYGIVLDNAGGGAAGDYRASNGTLIWDASVNATYHTNVVGIGRDDNTELLQKQSHTFDDTTRVYLSSLTSDNTGNAGSFSGNLQYLVLGDNAERLASLGSVEYPAGQGIYSRIEREWKITNTGFTNTFSIDITLDNVGSVTVSDIRILIDDDGDFTNAALYNPTMSYAAGVLTISGLSTTEIPMNSTRYITLVSLNGTTPLPVELVSFNALNQGGNVELTWQTAAEINSDYFSAERSNNSIDWAEFDKISAAGNSSDLLNYRLIDDQPFANTSYYRLKQVDYDGHISYSTVRAVNVKLSKNQDVRIFPNPASNTLKVEADNSDFDRILIYDISGKNVTSQITILERNDRQVVLNLSRLNSGIYVIKIANSATRFSKR